MQSGDEPCRSIAAGRPVATICLLPIHRERVEASSPAVPCDLGPHLVAGLRGHLGLPVVQPDTPAARDPALTSRISRCGKTSPGRNIPLAISY